jgi:hypothetical protein
MYLKLEIAVLCEYSTTLILFFSPPFILCGSARGEYDCIEFILCYKMRLMQVNLGGIFYILLHDPVIYPVVTDSFINI